MALHLAALLSGLLAALAFPPFDMPAVAWVAWVPWLLVLARGASVRSGLTSGLLHGFALHAVSLWWMVRVMTVHGGMSLPFAVGSFGAALVVLSPGPAVVGALAAPLARRHGFAGLAALAVAWGAVDAVRARFALGFPWIIPGMSQVHSPRVIGIADLGGVHAVSVLVLLVNVGLAAALAVGMDAARRRPRAAMRRDLSVSLGACMLVALALAYGSRARARHPIGDHRAVARLLAPGSPMAQLHAPTRGPVAGLEQVADPWEGPHREGELRAIIVQGSVPQDVIMSMDSHADTVHAAVQLSLSEAALLSSPDLVVWSESAYPATVSTLPWVMRWLRQLLEETRVRDGGSPEAVFGALVEVVPGLDAPIGLTNSALLMDSAGVKGRYDKVHLVPFGEYLPLSNVFFWFRRLVNVIGDLEPGVSTEPLPGARAGLGAFVCYEAFLPQHVGSLVRDGAEVLVNVTNDGWFHGSAAPEQHLAFSVMRAVENRRWVVRCANSGISAVVAPDGTVVGRLEEGQRGLLLAAVEPRHELTLYARVGDLPLLLAGALVAAWAVVSRTVVSRTVVSRAPMSGATSDRSTR